MKINGESIILCGAPVLQPPVFSSTEEISLYFKSLCDSVLIYFGPIKIKSSKPRPDPWLNGHTSVIRRK